MSNNPEIPSSRSMPEFKATVKADIDCTVPNSNSMPEFRKVPVRSPTVEAQSAENGTANNKSSMSEPQTAANSISMPDFHPTVNGVSGIHSQDAPSSRSMPDFRARTESPSKSWIGHIDWERQPARKQTAEEALAKNPIADPPEYQLIPPPATNPQLDGQRWKDVHYTVGHPLKELPSQSWELVKEEKAEDMRHVLEFPYNGEAPPNKLHESLITPNKYWFVRNHGGIPTIDPSQYELEIEGLVKNPRKIDLATLQDSNIFPQHTVLATIMCSGNRRMELQSAYPGEGDELVNAPWQQRAISTAKWTGVSLRNVMDYCGGPATGASHVEFIGADTYFKKNKVHSYAASVPWLKVRRDEVLLAWEMNGQPLPKLHGHPLRVVILGSVGARSVKWLFRVRALDQPSMSPVQRVEYLLQNHQIGKHNGDFVTGMPIMDLPVNSAFLSPSDTDVVIHEGKIHVKGWAYSGGGRWPEIVEVSADNGYSWYEVPFDNITEKHVWTLRLWEMELPVSAQGWVALKCRCWDNSLNVQPSDYRDTWNWSTHVNHSAHTLKIFSIDKRQKGTILQLENVKSQGKSLSPITLPVPFREEDPGSRWTEPPELTPAWARS